MEKLNLGIYEKALPKNIDWVERIKLVKECGYDFIEMSVDETDERLARLDWSDEEIKKIKDALIDTGVRIPTMCFSGHRRFPMGSMDEKIREKSMELMKKAIIFGDKLGIRVIQLAGYDVYYEEGNENTKKYFTENLKKALEWAATMEMTLAIEIMDHPFINSITKYMEFSRIVNSPWLKVYPDVGNLSAWPENDTLKELELGIKEREIVAIHLKDTLKVTDTFPGKFKEVPFGEGCVNFSEVFAKLKELNYKGPFLIEMWTEKSDNPIEEVKKAKQWIFDEMKKGGFI
ncbi:L-ribulose-5-phosphate 3-epimerase [Leptotrichia sp. OH3620_COT-345]|nr:L-ribulose-5-phosphate 3-epimerase [Leptotrichia sp. OH3620_COT-345]